MSVLEETLNLGVLINHEIKILPALRILNIKPHFLVPFSPVTEVPALDIAPNLLQLPICQHLRVPKPQNLVNIGFDLLNWLEHFQWVLYEFGVYLLYLTQFHWVGIGAGIIGEEGKLQVFVYVDRVGKHTFQAWLVEEALGSLQHWVWTEAALDHWNVDLDWIIDLEICLLRVEPLQELVL